MVLLTRQSMCRTIASGYAAFPGISHTPLTKPHPLNQQVPSELQLFEPILCVIYGHICGILVARDVKPLILL